MAKTITLRIDEKTYDIFKTAAESQRRTISNFIEYAAFAHLVEDSLVTDEEMQGILNDKQLMFSLSKAQQDIKKGKYKIVV